MGLEFSRFSVFKTFPTEPADPPGSASASPATTRRPTRRWQHRPGARQCRCCRPRYGKEWRGRWWRWEQPWKLKVPWHATSGWYPMISCWSLLTFLTFWEIYNLITCLCIAGPWSCMYPFKVCYTYTCTYIYTWFYMYQLSLPMSTLWQPPVQGMGGTWSHLLWTMADMLHRSLAPGIRHSNEAVKSCGADSWHISLCVLEWTTMRMVEVTEFTSSLLVNQLKQRLGLDFGGLFKKSRNQDAGYMSYCTRLGPCTISNCEGITGHLKPCRKHGKDFCFPKNTATLLLGT